MSRYEFWDKQYMQSQYAVEVAEKQKAIIPIVGQLALFEDQKMGELIQFPIRKPEDAA